MTSTVTPKRAIAIMCAASMTMYAIAPTIGLEWAQRVFLLPFGVSLVMLISWSQATPKE